jgi:hypothetical protein
MMEVMLYVNGLARKREDVNTGELAQDIAIILTRRPPDEFAEVRDRMMPGLIAYSATHPEFGKAWRNCVMEPPRQELRSILRRAIKRGKLPPSVNLDLSMSLLLGPMLYNHIFGNPPRTPNDKLGKLTAEAFVRAFAKG